MGKEKRNAADLEARSNYLAAKKQAEAEQKSKEKRKSILIGVCIVLVAVLMIGVIVYKNMAESGYLLRRETAAQSENFEVDGTMMAYYFKNQYQYYASSYGSYFGIKANVPLKAQTSPFGGTWFDYFMGLTKDYVNEMLSLCEAAKAAGVSLTDEDKAAIDSSIAEMKTYATMYGYTFDQYLIVNYGAGVNEKDLRNAMELANLASKYATEYQESLTYTAEELEAYYAENVDAFNTVDLLKFVVKRADFVETDEEGNVTGDLEEARKSAEEYAHKIAAAADVESFKSLVKEFLVNVQEVAEEDADKKLDTLLEEDVLKTTSSHRTEAMDWAFSAKEGEHKVFSEEDTTGKDVLFTVYHIVKAAGRDETLTRDVRHILFSFDAYESDEEAQAKAEEIYAEWEAAGFTLEKFEELSKTYNDDTGSVENGGLYEKVAPGDMVEEFNDWLFDAARVEGDHAIVETADYGWHIMNYVGENEVSTWEVEAEAALKQEDFQALVDEYETGVTFDIEVLGHIAA